MCFPDLNINWQVATKKGKNFELLTVSTVARVFWYLWQKKIKPFGPLYTNCYRQYDTHRDFPKEIINRFIKQAKEIEKQKLGSILKSFIQHEKILLNLRQFDRRIKQINFTKLSNRQLADLFSRSVFLHGQTVWYAYNPYFLQYLADDLYIIIQRKVKDLKSQAKYFEILTLANKFSLMQEEQLDLLRIALKVKQDKIKLNSKKSAELIVKHLNKYSFFGFYYLRGKAWTIKDVRLRVAEKVKKYEIKAGIKKILQAKKEINKWRQVVKKLKLTAGDITLVKTLKQIAYTMNLYEEIVNYHGFISQPFFREIANRIGVMAEEIIEMEAGEIINLLMENKKANSNLKSRLQERLRESALIMVNGKIEVLEGKSLGQYKKQQKSKQQEALTRELKGKIASAGQAKIIGRVILVRGLEDLSKVKKGDIMVVRNTTPSFVPAMERAAAIITETGGLLSHAAIVSRELGILCLVGVENVMKVLKDGDRVEVDANHGIVRKI